MDEIEIKNLLLHVLDSFGMGEHLNKIDVKIAKYCWGINRSDNNTLLTYYCMGEVLPRVKGKLRLRISPTLHHMDMEIQRQVVLHESCHCVDWFKRHHGILQNPHDEKFCSLCEYVGCKLTAFNNPQLCLPNTIKQKIDSSPYKTIASTIAKDYPLFGDTLVSTRWLSKYSPML